jgi:hypothetical protein
MSRMTPILILLAAVAASPEADAAKLDRQQFPLTEWPYLYYTTTATVPDDQRDALAATLRFVMPSLSAKTDLGPQLPVRVTETLYRIDTRAYGWETTWPAVLLKHYPFAPEQQAVGLAPLVVRADWIVAALMDPVETGDAQYQLLYGGKPPRTAAEFLEFWGIQKDPEYIFGTVEGQSGVSVERVRLIENRPGAKRNYGWITHDSRNASGENDPLENLPDRAKFDAQELIVGIPKWYGGKSGMLQAYFLANGKGERQDKAPADIVVDHSGIRGVEIRNTISCIACHKTGINAPTSDAFRAYVASGARVFADKVQQEKIDRYLGSDVAKEVTRNSADYADGILLVNGLASEDNNKQFIAAVHAYDADVTLEQAARELYVPKETFRLALGDYSRNYGLSGRLAFLAQDQPISRRQFNSNYQLSLKVLALWKPH